MFNINNKCNEYLTMLSIPKAFSWRIADARSVLWLNQMIKFTYVFRRILKKLIIKDLFELNYTWLTTQKIENYFKNTQI